MIHYVEPGFQQSLDQFARLFDGDKHLSLRFYDNEPGLTRLFNAQGSFRTMWRGQGIAGHGGSSSRSKQRSIMSALGEAVERYALSIASPHFQQKTYHQLCEMSLNAINPETITAFAPEQIASNPEAILNVQKTSTVDWSWFQDVLNDDRPILLPAMFNQPYKGQLPFYFSASTSGNGCGQDDESAQLSALLEFLERDAFAVYWWSKNRPRQIDLSHPSERLQKILEAFSEYLPGVTFFWTETDFQVTTVFATYQGDPRFRSPRFLVSAGASLDPITAIEKSLTEIEQLVTMFRRRYNSYEMVEYERDFDSTIWDFLDHVHLYSYRDMHYAYEFLFPNQPETISWSDLKDFSQGHTRKNLEFLTAQFRQNKIRLYFSNLSDRTIKSAGLAVWRAFSPDLAVIDFWHKYRAVGFPRLYKLPKQMGWKNQPSCFAELNPDPHPFP